MHERYADNSKKWKLDKFNAKLKELGIVSDEMLVGTIHAIKISPPPH